MNISNILAENIKQSTVNISRLSVLERMMTKSAVARRTAGIIRKIPRAIWGLSSTPEDFLKTPPIIVNSVPKSGTNLLVQIAKGIPNTRNYGTLWTNIPSYSYKEYSKKNMLSMIDSTVPGEVVVAHLFGDPDYKAALERKNAVHLFIYRDPRAIALSEAHYLTYMNRWHRLHSHYKALPNDDERLSFSIVGAPEGSLPFSYPNVAERFGKYQGWLAQENVFTVRFEDLVSERRIETIEKLVRFYLEKTSIDQGNVDELVTGAINNINPAKSHTFRQGKVNSWKEAFTEKHKQQIEAVAGDLLRELGYDNYRNCPTMIKV